jgi:hypothetical protein
MPEDIGALVDGPSPGPPTALAMKKSSVSIAISAQPAIHHLHGIHKATPIRDKQQSHVDAPARRVEPRTSHLGGDVTGLIPTLNDTVAARKIKPAC